MPIKKSAKIKRDPVPENEQLTDAQRKRVAKKDAKRALGKTGKIVLVAIACAAMLLSVTAMACSGVLNQASSSEDYQLTGGVAAVVEGVNITEDTITKQIMSFRSSGGYESDEDWATYLKGQGLTPATYRENMINSYARQYLLTKAVKDEGITVSDDEIQEAWDNAAKQYGSEDSLKSLVTAMGYTEDSYKETLASQLQQQKLKEAVAPEKDATDDEVLSYFNENVDTYNDARRSENLLIKVDSDASDDDKAEAKKKAEDILAKIQNGELTFEDAVEKYSEDTGSKADKGDVGWDKLTSFVTEYQSALNELSKGQMSGVVETSYGYHIIKCTDYFHVDGKADKIDQLPSEIKDYIANVVETQAQTTAYNEWLDSYIEKADIKINDMPENVPYNVDMSKAKDDSEKAGSSE